MSIGWVSDEVAIVSGLPRSGTSMMMRMLDAAGISAISDGVRSADTDNPRGYFEFEPSKRTKEDPSWLADARGKAVKMVYKLLYDLPDDYRYRVIYMRRNLDEILASQQAMLRRLEQSDSVPNAVMARLFEKEIAASLEWLETRENFAFMQVSYNEVLDDPETQIGRINDFFGGDLDVEEMRRVVEPQLYRNRS